MKLKYVAGLTGVSVIALSSSLIAQEVQISQTPGVIVLSPITLIADGQETVEATGGVIVSREDLEVLQPTDISDVFRRDSAVRVSAGTGPAKRVHVFGIEQSNLAVTVDGVPQFGDNWHHAGSNVIDPSFLKRVDVDAGAAPADAGFGAGAGAVRYETLGARDLLTEGRTQGGRAGLSYGSNGRGLSTSLAGYGVYERFDWFAMLHRAKGDEYDNGDGNEVAGSETDVTGALIKLGYESEGHRVEASYEHAVDDGLRPAKMNFDLLREDGAVYPLKVTRDSLSLRYSTTTPTGNWDPEALIYLNRNEYERPNYVKGGTDGDMNMQAEGFGGVLKNNFQVGQGTITAGVDFSYADYTIDNYESGAIIGRDGVTPTGENFVQIHNLETAQIGTFVQGRFEFSNGVDLSTGLRLDHHRFTDWNGQRFTDSGASINGTLSYEFSPGYEVFAGASRTWLGYDIGEYGYLHARGSNTITEPDFKPASSENYKVGFNASQDNWTGNITFFDTRLNDLPNSYSYVSANGEVNNLDNVNEEYRSKGVTLQGNYSWGSGRAGASFTSARLTTDGEKILPAGGDIVPVGQVASVYIDQEFAQYNLKVGGNIELAKKMTGDYLTEAGFEEPAGYGIVNAYAQWRPQQYENVVVQLNVDNLFDKTYYERSSYVENTVRGGGIRPVYAPGRTVSLGLTVDF